jgi:hypothetical protein
LKDKEQKYTFDDSLKEKKVKTKHITKEALLEVGDISEYEFRILKKNIERNNATTEDKLKVERYYYKKHWEVKYFDSTFLNKAYQQTSSLFNYKGLCGLPVRKFDTLDEDNQDVDIVIKKQKLKIVNNLLENLSFKTKSGEFTGAVFNSEDFEDHQSDAIENCKLFTDKATLTLFGKSKTKLDTTKAFLGFVNKILENYGVRIQSHRQGKESGTNNKINYYSLKHIFEEPIMCANEFYERYEDFISYDNNIIEEKTPYEIYTSDLIAKYGPEKYNILYSEIIENNN